MSWKDENKEKWREINEAMDDPGVYQIIQEAKDRYGAPRRWTTEQGEEVYRKVKEWMDIPSW